GYTWQTVLGTMGLNDMNGRIEDAVTGRFLSADPTISNPGNTQSYNRYAYVYNNPLSFSDPSGFVPCNGRVDDGCRDRQQAITDSQRELARYRAEFEAWLSSLANEYNDWVGASPISIGEHGEIIGAPFERELARGVAIGAVPASAGKLASDYDAWAQS